MSERIVGVQAPRCQGCGCDIEPIFMGHYAFWLCEACRTLGELGAWQDFIRWPQAHRHRDAALWEIA